MFICQFEHLLHQNTTCTNTRTQRKIKKECFYESHSNKRILLCSILGTKSLFKLENNIQYIHERAKLKSANLKPIRNFYSFVSVDWNRKENSSPSKISGLFDKRVGHAIYNACLAALPVNKYKLLL